MDLYLFTGPMDGPLVATLMDLYQVAVRRKNVGLILTTYGGSPDAAFMLARFLKRKYAQGTFTVYVLGSCKSAGTLVALGADHLVMSPHGEMGPLDIQLAKEDSLSARDSGMDIFTALSVLNTTAYAYFEHTFSQLLVRTGHQMTTRTAAGIATNIATALLTPITAQIDPLRLGSMQRAVEITRKYGEMLKPQRPDVVDQLITGYPSHGFVIDFQEAEQLFGNVREPAEDELRLVQTLGQWLAKVTDVECIRAPHPEGIAECLTRAPAAQTELGIPIHADPAPDGFARHTEQDSGTVAEPDAGASAQNRAGLHGDFRPDAAVSGSPPAAAEG